jgi:hypothetical protein
MPLQALRAAVPKHHAAVQIAHDNGVMGQVQQSRLFVQFIVGALALSNVAHHFAIPSQGPARLIQGCDHGVSPEPGAVLAHSPAFPIKASRGRGLA